MKILTIVGALVIGAIFFTPKQKNMAGTWVQDTADGKQPAVIRVQMTEGYYSAKLDLPDQQVYDMKVSLAMKNDSLRIILDEKQEVFIETTITDSTLVGRSVVDGKSEPVSFRRLND